MKWFFFALPSLFFIFCIGNNEFSSNTDLSQEIRESYQACIKLKIKAPFFNLKCEQILDNISYIETNDGKNININKGVKVLSIYESSTRKVKKSEEIKLRNLIAQLSNRNKLRK